MAYTRNFSIGSHALLAGQAWAQLTAAPTLLLARCRTASTRKALSELSPDQLVDIGREQPSRPQMIVEAGLMTKLMSMR